jgi:H+-translocating NAD(P) transhydrogenase subunit alpha
MKIAVARERTPGEARVALVPDTVAKIRQSRRHRRRRTRRRPRRGFTDAAYEAAGATIGSDASAVVSDVDIVVRVGRPSDAELEGLKRGAMFVGSRRCPESICPVAGISRRPLATTESIGYINQASTY